MKNEAVPRICKRKRCQKEYIVLNDHPGGKKQWKYCRRCAEMHISRESFKDIKHLHPGDLVILNHRNMVAAFWPFPKTEALLTEFNGRMKEKPIALSQMGVVSEVATPQADATAVVVKSVLHDNIETVGFWNNEYGNGTFTKIGCVVDGNWQVYPPYSFLKTHDREQHARYVIRCN